MVAKVISGKNIRGLLNYNENKVAEGVAQCLEASGFGCDPRLLSFSDKLNRFLKMTARNPKVRTHAIHISLNFDVSEHLSNERLCAVAADYMSRIGFAHQPYLVYRHDDAAHPHIHLVTTNIQHDGRRIDIHNIGRNQSEKARKEIEIAFGLVRAQGRSADIAADETLRKIVYGKTETRKALAHIVGIITRTYRYTSLPELNAALRQYNVIADRGTEGTPMYQRRGLRYHLLDDQGTKVGVPIKASALPHRPTLAYLSRRYELNSALREPYKLTLKNTVERILRQSPSQQEFVKAMARKGVFVLIRSNDAGRIYGITFVDNKNKVVYNGSDLGKKYGATSIAERWLHPQPVYQEREALPSPTPDDPRVPKSHLHIDELAAALTTAQPYDFTSPEVALQTKKKRRKKKSS